MDIDGANLVNVTKGIFRQSTNPSPLPDGRIIFFGFNTDEGGRNLYRINPDGSGLTEILAFGANDYFATTQVSPDGTQIVFASYRDGNREIYVMNNDGSNLRRLTNHLASDQNPSWSPDGRHIASLSTRDGTSHIYVMDSDGGNVTRLARNEARDGSLAWR